MSQTGTRMLPLQAHAGIDTYCSARGASQLAEENKMHCSLVHIGDLLVGDCSIVSRMASRKTAGPIPSREFWDKLHVLSP